MEKVQYHWLMLYTKPIRQLIPKLPIREVSKSMWLACSHYGDLCILCTVYSKHSCYKKSPSILTKAPK